MYLFTASIFDNHPYVRSNSLLGTESYERDDLRLKVVMESTSPKKVC